MYKRYCPCEAINTSNNKWTKINLIRNNCQPGTNFDFPVKKYAGKNRIVQRKLAESIWRACALPFKSRNLLYILCSIWSDNLGTLAYKVCIIESGTTQRINTDARGTYKVRNEKKRNEINKNETKRNENNEMKTKPTKAKRNQRNTMLDYFPHMSQCLSSGEDRIWSPLNKNIMHLFSGSLSFSLSGFF